MKRLPVFEVEIESASDRIKFMLKNVQGVLSWWYFLIALSESVKGCSQIFEVESSKKKFAKTTRKILKKNRFTGQG